MILMFLFWLCSLITCDVLFAKLSFSSHSYILLCAFIMVEEPRLFMFCLNFMSSCFLICSKLRMRVSFNQSVVEIVKVCVINTWAGIVNCANLGMEVMHERNALNFLATLTP